MTPNDRLPQPSVKQIIQIFFVVGQAMRLRAISLLRVRTYLLMGPVMMAAAGLLALDAKSHAKE
jgi:hypothetical protein